MEDLEFSLGRLGGYYQTINNLYYHELPNMQKHRATCAKNRKNRKKHK